MGNPLFETHWFSSDNPSAQLAAAPAQLTNLRLCPAYNGVASCCTREFEAEQTKHFEYWRAIFTAKLHHIQESYRSVKSVMQRDVYNAASDSDREQHTFAMQKYQEVLDPTGHAQCFAALVTYVAGMQCFACEPKWNEQVVLDASKTKVVRVRLTQTSCKEVWADCKKFGVLAQQLKQAMLDSRLATMQSMPFENLDMLHDQQILCDWLHDAIAMHPFATPTEADREAAPMPQTIVRRLGADDMHFDVMKAGRASGFDIRWAGITNYGHTGTSGAASVAYASQVLLMMSGLFACLFL